MCSRTTGPLSTSRLRRPGVRASSASIASATVPASTSQRRTVPGIRLTSERGRRTVTATPASVDLDGLDAPDRWQVVGDPLPGPALVARPVQLARARPEIHACGIAPVDRHRLAQHADVGVLLGQAARLALPGVAAIVRAPDRERPARCGAALLGMAEREHPRRRGVARMRAHDEAELR